VFSALLQKTCHSVQSPCFEGDKNKKSGEYFKIRILKLSPRHLYPQSTGTVKSPPQSMGTKKSPPQSMGTKKSTPLWGAVYVKQKKITMMNNLSLKRGVKILKSYRFSLHVLSVFV
jgi:hypothetical protein